jgi:ADP-heptose:LPS heptosyltransferase
MNWKLIRIVDTCLGIPILIGKSLLGDQKKKRPVRDDSTPDRILLIKFWGIGNIAMILPSIKALRSTWPLAPIDFLTLESNRDALETFGLVDGITTIDTGSTMRFISSWRAAVDGLSGRRYDIIIDFEQFARFSALIAHQVGGGRTIGFRTLGQHRHRLFSDAVEYDDHVHITRSFFSLAVKAGVASPFPDGFTLPGLKTLQKRGRRLLADAGLAPDEPVVVIHIGTSDNFRERRWPPEYYAHVSDHLAGRYGVRTVLTGLADESFLIVETISHLNAPAAAIDLGGKLNFGEFTALIAAAGMVLSADTAAVHLASALDVPVIGIYGPNTPRLYGPWGKRGLALYDTFECSPCITNFNSKINTCRHPDGQGACMRAISAQDACNAIDRFLATGVSLQALRGEA